MHVCGGRCTGEGGLKADEVGGLGSWGGVDVGGDEEVVLEDGVHGDLEVKCRRWRSGEEDLEGNGVVGESGF